VSVWDGKDDYTFPAVLPGPRCGARRGPVAGTIDIEALRRFRANAQWDNWIKDLTTEQYQLTDEEPVYPKKLYLDRAPYQHDEYRREVIARQVDLMHKRDTWVPPERDEAG
jgi:hypothetical protein